MAPGACLTKMCSATKRSRPAAVSTVQPLWRLNDVASCTRRSARSARRDAIVYVARVCGVLVLLDSLAQFKEFERRTLLAESP